MPERLECEVLQKARYINTLTFTFTFNIHWGNNVTGVVEQLLIRCVTRQSGSAFVKWLCTASIMFFFAFC